MEPEDQNLALSVKGLVRKFKDFTLGPVNLDLEPGAVVGLIGPNGSGKTTLINTIVGLLRMNAGSVEIFGRKTDQEDIKWKFDTGYVGDEHVFFELWNGEMNLKFLSQFYPKWSWDKTYGLAKKFKLDLKKRANKLSKGNRAKLALISALSYSPRLLLLDEPSSGFDPIVRSEFLDALWEINEAGDTAIFYSTHILSDISRIADELVFIVDGQLVTRNKKEDLLDKWRQISFISDSDIREIKNVVNIKRQDNYYIVISSEYEKTVESIKKYNARDIQVSPMMIDDIAVQILKGYENVETG
jgi:ABC-2 type transport system ATP-binding protein